MMNKKSLVKIATVTFSMLVVLTFFSKTIYDLSLTGVQTTGIDSALISLSTQTEGQIICTETIAVNAGANWSVESVFVKNGQRVSKGDLLLTTDTRDWELGKLTNELEILRLENSLAALDEAHEPTKTAEIYAPFDGHLLSAENVSIGQKLVQDVFMGRYVDDSAFLLTVYFIEPYRDKIQVGMSAAVTLSEWMYSAEGTVTAVSKAVHVMDGIRAFSVDVSIDNPGALTEGTSAFVELNGGNSEVMLAIGLGELRYAREELLYAPMSGVVSECLLETGMHYNKDAVMLSMQEEMQSEDGRAVQRSRTELETQLKIAKRQLERYRKPYGPVLAEVDGYVGNLSVKDGDHPSTGSELLCIYPDGAPLEVSFTLPIASGKDYGAGTPVSVKYFSLEADSVFERTCISQISERTLSDDGVSFDYRATIDEYDGCILTDVAAQISVNGTGSIYDIVVPSSCVSDRGDGKFVYIMSKRQGLFGIEYYVTEYKVRAIGGNTYQTALEPGTVYKNMDVVVYASRPLADGDIVKVHQP